MGYTVPLTHIPFGSILGEDRKIMRTRSGENVALRDLLDEAVERARAVVDEKNADLPADEKAEIARIIGLGAVKYAEPQPAPVDGLYFQLGQDAFVPGQHRAVPAKRVRPHPLDLPARATSTRNWVLTPPRRSRSPNPPSATSRKKLAQFAEAVPLVLEDFRPNLLANYLYELAGTFHTFFEACPVLKADAGAPRETRLTLCRVTARVLRVGLGLLGIEAPERM